MTHKLILKVKKFQLSSAKRFGTVEEKPPERVNFTPPPNYLGLNIREVIRSYNLGDKSFETGFRLKLKKLN